MICVWGLLGLNPACMSPEEHVAEADAESYAILTEARKTAGVDGDPDFSIDRRSDLLRDRLLIPRPDDTIPGPRERLALEGEEVAVDLGTALQIAARNSRSFQDQKEALYRAALRLTGSLNDFESQYFGTISASGSASGDGENASVSMSENSSLGFTRLIERGGSFNLAIGQNLTRFLTDPAGTSASAFINLTLSLPLLRGAGREIAYERVIQSERDVVYAVRSFERFKRTFAVNIVSDYLRLLQSAQTVDNERQNLERRELTADENRALGEAGRLPRTDVERANSSLLTARNRVVVAEQRLESDLDQFKLSLGLPTDAALRIDIEDLENIRDLGVDGSLIDELRALEKGIGYRLDLATADDRVQDARRQVVVAKDALLAGLDFDASYGQGTNDFGENGLRIDLIGDADFSLGAILDLPLERTRERNAYRETLISYEATRRDAEEFEDVVKLEIRRGVRNLQQAAESYRIQLESVRVAEINLDAAQLLKDAGTGTTNDLVDAQNDLIQAQNAVTAALIDYMISRLSLFRDMGVLVVGEDGIDEATTRKLLEDES